MVIGGTSGINNRWTNDVEVVSPNGAPIPYCQKSLNPFPFGTIHNGEAAAISKFK